MAIINGNRSTKKEKIKAEISVDILKQIEQYCAWAKIDDVGYFIEEAAYFVFAKDKEWKQYQKSLKRAAKETA
ncbi:MULTISPECIES: hypothetical protein [Legionella]|uniref:Uncharacterized protein n=1 Tax=Legionella maceachernii TaxID=466 RepID=A0A0W0W5B8_9GAMM|nr:hypothetical protein [Legionella maceachernii]KTD27078.1 hypothetical protein Lmac_1326 [Legionella maceachernii]SKA04528.1 hypothetical protein SAMN02745128_01884 [Legionella maceachernii]SUP00279.1 Uncharacterised protein [Legionella maceachernii]